jgi:integral membrane sensor domain MASE1
MMNALAHVFKVLLVVVSSILMVLLKVGCALVVIFLLLWACIKFPTFGDVFFAILGALCGVALLFLFLMHLTDVSDSIKRNRRKNL